MFCLVSDHVVLLCVAILVILFLFQQYGTSKVGFTFSPIMLVWFALISSTGLYNIIKHYPPILKAISPHYIYLFFARNKRVGWEQFGTVVLCITGKKCKLTILLSFSFLFQQEKTCSIIIESYRSLMSYNQETSNIRSFFFCKI
jgi:KUP system potassium uptake protein